METTMTILTSILLLTYFLPILFTCEVHRHSCSTEYGVRVCGGYKTEPVLVIGLGKLIVRIK